MSHMPEKNDASLIYQYLTPEMVLNAVESLGIDCDGRLQALNSFENRVYLVGVNDSADVVAKFYRPRRWSDEQILEEHAFCNELAQLEIPVVKPEEFDGFSLITVDDFRFAIFQKKGGRAPDLENDDTLEQLGRFLGRTHAVGKATQFAKRPELNIETYGIEAREFLLENDFIPADLRTAYETLTADLLTGIAACYARAGKVDLIRTHTDFHPGNILWTDSGPHIVDLDDCRHAPACQDLWMLLNGDRTEMNQSLDAVLEGYT